VQEEVHKTARATSEQALSWSIGRGIVSPQASQNDAARKPASLDA